MTLTVCQCLSACSAGSSMLIILFITSYLANDRWDDLEDGVDDVGDRSSLDWSQTTTACYTDFRCLQPARVLQTSCVGADDADYNGATRTRTLIRDNAESLTQSLS